jgi:transposase, IS5 family
LSIAATATRYRGSGRTDEKPHQIQSAGAGRTCDRGHQGVFGFAKVRYRGLKKNTHRLLVTCALPNLFMARRHLLRCQRA